RSLDGISRCDISTSTSTGGITSHGWTDRPRSRIAPATMQKTEMFNTGDAALLAKVLERLAAGFRDLPECNAQSANASRWEEVLVTTADRLQDIFPYFHPLYAGQMLKPPHPVARLAYALAMYINPNNHALDGGRATSAMEKESVSEI